MEELYIVIVGLINLALLVFAAHKGNLYLKFKAKMAQAHELISDINAALADDTITREELDEILLDCRDLITK